MKLIPAQVAFAFLFACTFAESVLIPPASGVPPDRKNEKPKPKPKPPAQIAGPCRFGDITQDGRTIQISGNNAWYASAEIRPDGKLLVHWIRQHDGVPATGLYEIGDDGSIIGAYGYTENVTTDEDGTIQGLSFSETLRDKAAVEQ